MSDDFTFQIKADPSQALEAEVKVTVGLGQIEAKAKDAGKAMSDAMDDAAGHMGDLIALAAGFVSAHALESFADGYTEISNKLRVVSTDQANLNGLMDATLAVAQDTRTSWDDVVSTYQRLSNVTRGLGLSQRDVLDLEKEIGEAAKVSGASSRETSMAMAELTHAFATGVVQGREFRVLMRDVPQLMHELQQASGKTQSAFAEMGKHGQITAQLLIDWFGKAKGDIEDKFGSTVPTISDQLTKLHNAAEQFFGSSATGTGVMRALTDAMQFVIDHFETFGKVLLGAGQAIVGLYVIEKVIALVKLLSAAIAANPLGALVTAAIVAIGVLRQFGDQIDIDSGGVAKLSDFFEVLWEKIKKLASAVVDFVENAWHKLTDAFSSGLDSTGIELSLRNVLLFIASFADAAVGIFKFVGDTIMTIFGAIGVAIGKLFQDIVNGFIVGINDLIDAKDKIQGFVPGHQGAGFSPDEQMKRAYEWSQKMQEQFSKSAADATGLVVTFASVSNQIQVMQKDGAAATADQMQKLGTVWKSLGLPGQVGDITPQMSPGGKGGITQADHIAPISIVGNVSWGDVGDAFLGKIKKDFKDDIQGTSTIKDIVSNFMDEVDKHAIDRVKNAKPAAEATVSTTRGAVEAVEMTDAQRRALEKLKNELRAIMEQTNPVTDAELKLAHAQDILNQGVKANLISYAQAETAMSNYRAKLEDQLHPYDAMVRKLIEQTAALRSTALEQEHAQAMEHLANEAKKAGIELTDKQVAQLDHLTRNLESQKRLMQEEHSLYDQIQGPVEKYALTQRALNDLLSKGKIDATQYAIATDQTRLAYLKASQAGNSVQGGLERGWLTIKQQVLDVGTAVESLVVKEFNDLNSAIVELCTTGTTNWSKMIDSMLADLTKLLIQMEEAKLIQAIAGGGSGNAAVAALSGHAYGGSWMVGGTGGTDSQVVAFRASPNERVTVTTPEQDGRAAAYAGGGSTGRAQVHVHNHYDRRELLSVLDSPEGHATVVNVMRKNPGAMRSILQK